MCRADHKARVGPERESTARAGPPPSLGPLRSPTSCPCSGVATLQQNLLFRIFEGMAICLTVHVSTGALGLSII